MLRDNDTAEMDGTLVEPAEKMVIIIYSENAYWRFCFSNGTGNCLPPIIGWDLSAEMRLLRYLSH